MEIYFPEKEVCFIAVDDNYDSNNEPDIIAPIKNVLNESYASDISRKVRAIVNEKGKAGIPLGKPPYGYIKNSENKHQWIIDPESSEVVKRIFDLYVAGNSLQQIADMLEHDRIIPPFITKKLSQRRIALNLLITCAVGIKAHLPKFCLGESIILVFKTYSKSYKIKARQKTILKII